MYVRVRTTHHRVGRKERRRSLRLEGFGQNSMAKQKNKKSPINILFSLSNFWLSIFCWKFSLLSFNSLYKDRFWKRYLGLMMYSSTFVSPVSIITILAATNYFLSPASVIFLWAGALAQIVFDIFCDCIMIVRCPSFHTDMRFHLIQYAVFFSDQVNDVRDIDRFNSQVYRYYFWKSLINPSFSIQFP